MRFDRGRHRIGRNAACHELPEGVPDTLNVSHVHEAAPSAFPNGAHVAEVEIDPDTGWSRW